METHIVHSAYNPDRFPITEPASTLRWLFEAAIEAARPSRVLPRFLNRIERPKGRTVVVGAGKAAGAMAAAFEASWDGSFSGVVATRYGHGARWQRIRVIEAAHPVPDDAAMEAARAMLLAVEGLTADDLFVGLWSGGGSSLLTLPAPGVTLAQKQSVTQQLLKSGAGIGEINAVRKRLSAIKGGRLAAAASTCRIVNLIVSDVVGDDPSTVASGPMVADASTREEALDVIRRYGIDLDETLLSGPPLVLPNEAHIVASSPISIAAVAEAARREGIETSILSDSVEGEARSVGMAHAEIARRIAQERAEGGPPLVLLSGGETTVRVQGNGRGGRNVEYLIALALGLKGHPRIYALAADTDGIDGTEPVAGAFIDPTTLARATALGISLDDVLRRNDAHSLFEKLEDQIVTGPTRTNVNDFRAILIR